MTETPATNGIGARLRAAREARGWAVADAARELRVARVVLEAMEREDWQRLGAPVFARGHLSAYAERLGVAIDVNQAVGAMAQPALQPRRSDSAWAKTLSWSLPRVLRIAVVFAGLAVLVLVLDLLRDGRGETLPVVASESSAEGGIGIDTPVINDGADAGNAFVEPTVALDDEGEASPEPVDGSTAQTPVGATGVALEAETAAAAMEAVANAMPDASAETAPLQSAQAGAGESGAAQAVAGVPAQPGAGDGAVPALRMVFRSESWVEIIAADGGLLERALVPAGSVREYRAGAVGRVTLGNADGVLVQVNGSDVNLDPWRSANVARFALSSEGVAPVRR